MYHYIHYEFDNLDQLTIFTNHMFQVSDKDKSINFITPNLISIHGNIIKKRDSTILFYDGISQSIFEFKKPNKLNGLFKLKLSNTYISFVSTNRKVLV